MTWAVPASRCQLVTPAPASQACGHPCSVALVTP